MMLFEEKQSLFAVKIIISKKCCFVCFANNFKHYKNKGALYNFPFNAGNTLFCRAIFIALYDMYSIVTKMMLLVRPPFQHSNI